MQQRFRCIPSNVRQVISIYKSNQMAFNPGCMRKIRRGTGVKPSARPPCRTQKATRCPASQRRQCRKCPQSSGGLCHRPGLLHLGFRVFVEVLEHYLGVLVPVGHAVREGDASAVVPTNPKAVHLRLRRLQLGDYPRVAKLILRDCGGPQLACKHLGRWRVGLEEHLSAALIHLRDDVLLVHLTDLGVSRATNIVEEYIVFGRAAAREERRRPQGTQRSHALRTRVEASESGEVAQRPKAVVELFVAEGALRVGDGDGGDGRGI
mmetsp:Transcript_2211/g.6981  ORF Transcript_2211/g.6981 Transcript_2211/m.6981 type:complete len:264 (+) Transcript_2211:109-900(+)